MAMQKRRSHKKSRRGCLNCKKWHTKCDESGPPCNNCILRNAKCEYSWAIEDTSSAVGMKPRRTLSRKLSTGTSSSSAPSLCDPANLVLSEARRRLELELMHCWSTTTYKSLCSVPEDHHYMQFTLPQEALQYDFLMNGIFVSAALHKATMAPEPEAKVYYNTAMELYNRASVSFRKHLAKMDPGTHHMLYIFSSMAAFINIAFSQCKFSSYDELNTLSTIAVAFDLLNGSVNIAQADFQRLLDSPVPVQAYYNYGRALDDALDLETLGAITRLEALTDLYNVHQYRSSPPLYSNDSSRERSVSVPPPVPWKDIVRLLQRCFAEDYRGVFRGFCFVFPGGAGPEFVAAVKAADPMALMILMHWTVLLSRAQTEYWWASGLGPRLAVGIWKAIGLSATTYPPPAIMLEPEWCDSVVWICSKLGLPEFI
ncbi:hypothetical protein F5Y16DRAFT_371945 [Xylariaceae sp. FL0255]|nr:hypothetical protein F5Y16DRAFT_371945 [Xylariaceae sp. FL0255]